jgi:hypothetical protein
MLRYQNYTVFTRKNVDSRQMYYPAASNGVSTGIFMNAPRGEEVKNPGPENPALISPQRGGVYL